ncbi:MAG TPA: DUF4365 domain-containing protein [Cyclobacteriaceae bacterium]|jgi:GTPase Era involved in 16S rRNA processing|nr:DUF4365 domain-containing protein [Cyclobacteriaceae bacterium]
MPQYHSTHRKENNSKREFEKLVDPWVVNWAQKDYGVDAFVQVGNEVNDAGSSKLESLFFHVQLKSTAKIDSKNERHSVKIEIDKIKSWASANIRVLLVLYVQQLDKFFIKWIDDAFVSELSVTNPDWSTKTSVSVKFISSDEFNTKSKSEIRRLLLKTNHTKAVIPGTYFNLKKCVKERIESFDSLSAQFGFESTGNIVKNLTSNLEKAIYRVAVVGPSKVGKSSLINALLRRDISPVGVWQTTGVAIQVIPGDKDQIEIYFKDGTKTSKPFTKDTVKQFASQDFNVANEKKVKLVSISMVNESLEKGVSFFDIPGLDDPDDDILQDTWSFVKTFNAVIYIIEVSSAATGSFVFRSDYKKHINEIGASSDKIFLIFNKTDVLQSDRLEELKKRIKHDMQRLNLADKVSKNLYYVSANLSLNKRLSPKNRTDEVDQLDSFEEDLWAFLLTGNRLGIDKLISTVGDLRKGSYVFEDILKARLIDSEKLALLRGLIKEITDKQPELNNLFRIKHLDIKKSLELFLETKQTQLLSNLHNGLKSYPIAQDLPKATEIRKFLSDGVNKIINEGNEEHLRLQNQLKNDADIWIEGNLKKVRELLNASTDTRYVNTAPIESMKVPDIDLSESFGMGILGAFFAAILSPGALVVGALVGFFGHLIFSAESRRVRKISRIMETTKAHSAIVFNDIQKQYQSVIDEYVAIIKNYADQKITNYFSDIHLQIKEIKLNPLSVDEQEKYRQSFIRLSDLRDSLEQLTENLIQYR